MNPGEAKARLRRQQRRMRRRIPAAERREASRAITEHLVKLPVWRSAQTVALFASSREEVDTSTLIDIARAEGKCVALPAVEHTGAPLTWRAPGTRGTVWTLQDGPFGIQEPTPDAPEVSADAIDLFVVPCLAVDPRGYRVGYGGGYYDRSLAAAGADATRVIVAFHAQLLPAVPVEDFDVPGHWLVTEQRALVLPVPG